MSIAVKQLEPACYWTARDVADPETWTVHLDDSDIAEINQAVAAARPQIDDLLSVTRDHFPLPTLGKKLKAVEEELINGRGFCLISGLPRDKYTNDEMCLIYWGVGMHLGLPWPQNKYGHLLGDVTDHGKSADDPEARGYQLGGAALPFHTDGSDLVGLLCLNDGASGGESAICNAVAVYNDFVKEAPELAAELFKPQPYDFRGEQPAGGKGWYQVPVFTAHQDRLFVRYIPPYIYASQRHEDAPRLTETALKAMERLNEMIADPQYHVYMKMQPGDMQFVNNYHVLHARKEYTDDKDAGKVRHLKRLWLETATLTDRPIWFQRSDMNHWGDKKVISRMDAAQ
ncbi:MAG: TauD/TfdA family dioxygenase [Alphaproteobacteria bacterium]